MSLFTPEPGTAPLPRQQAIEDHLSATQSHLQPGGDIQRAAFHANRAASLINQACAALKRVLLGRKDGAE